MARGSLEEPDPLPPGWTTQVSRSTGKTYYCNHSTGESTFDRNDPIIPTVAKAPAPAPAQSYTPTKPGGSLADGASSGGAGTKYKVQLAARVRSGFEQSSTDAGIANVGDIVVEIESRANASGIKRVRFDRCEHTPSPPHSLISGDISDRLLAFAAAGSAQRLPMGG